MPTYNNEFTIHVGDAGRILSFTLYDEAEALVNLTGYTPTLSMFDADGNRVIDEAACVNDADQTAEGNRGQGTYTLTAADVAKAGTHRVTITQTDGSGNPTTWPTRETDPFITVHIVDQGQKTLDLVEGDTYDGTTHEVIAWTVAKDYTGFDSAELRLFEIIRDEPASVQVITATIDSATQISASFTMASGQVEYANNERTKEIQFVLVAIKNGNSETIIPNGLANVTRRV